MSAAAESISPIPIIPNDKEYNLNRWLCVTALFMASLNLRPIVSSIAPVLGSIQHDLGLSFYSGVMYGNTRSVLSKIE